jgi:ABC-2 type transport system ATP-binding protein
MSHQRVLSRPLGSTPTDRPAIRVKDRLVRPNHQRSAIEVCDLAKTYPGGVEAVVGVSFAVAPGEVFGLLGPNGAGKSTTIGMLTSTVAPTRGSAHLAGHDVGTDPLGARGVSAVVFQDAVVDRPLTGRRNLDIHARLWALEPAVAARRIDDVAKTFGITELLDRPVATYSGGQRRRLELARALVSRPRVLFLDEPTVGLDPRIRYELLEVIASLRDVEEMTILLTTHYLDEAERLCDRVGIMHAGRLVAIDTPTALLAEIGPQVVEVRVSGHPADAVRLLRDAGLDTTDSYTVGQTITLRARDRSAEDITGVVRALPAVSASSIATRPPSLDDVYLRLTGDRIAA